MFSSHKIIRRFTPPTCTLEIWAENSLFYRWNNHNFLKNLQFKLSFDDPRLPTEKQITIQGDLYQLEQLYEVVNNYVHNFLQLSLVENYSPDQALLTKQSSQTITNTNQPQLQPLNLVNHELNLGNLNQQHLDQKIKLSSSQLFDIFTALEEYQTEISVFPQSLNNNKTSKNPLLWGSIAAVTLLAAGLTIIGTKVFYLSEKEANTVSVQKSSPTINPKINDIVPPKLPETENKPIVQPNLTGPLSSAEKLPPPPPVDLPKPPPNIPDPAKFPLPESNTFTIPQPAPPTVAVKPESVEKSPSLEQQITIQPNAVKPSSTNQKSPDNSKQDNLSESDSVPSQTNNQSENIDSSDISSIPSFSPEQKQNQIAAQTNQTSIPEIPQVKEIEQYFKTQWQTPEGLKQTLEYRLILSPNGSIKRIIPLGKTSQIYLDRTNIPLMGETFVSPLAKQEDATIRLLLSPDGEVKTFLE
ncbi:hypothetical protein Sta7437_1249 [Stanieria cyanosphaera PCC 7437]|uniref:DUF4335 domain-containing protein n=1 Tax=Stanieria cyanosphaera (strain ATCC 29371 / PCC 7437) TaxID=111780 RepID=K9XRV9_STAC7|nr:DUF4335 domain-containing protein [Stanieria cyanosphaera]AFZ34819.1 hypothetical protein Sta7437_1249 [Stanieria cyanosphaera PCC 7437]